MIEFSTGFSRILRPELATAELARAVESAMGGADRIAGGLLFSTAASGSSAREIGALLSDRWPDALLMGSSFEGLLANGQVWRDEPAYGLLAWAKGVEEPLPFLLELDELGPDQLAHDLLEATGRSTFRGTDLLLLFPDALATVGLEESLTDVIPGLGRPSIAGAAASGLGGGPSLTWFGTEDHPASALGLLVPSGAGEVGEAEILPILPRVRCAEASRFASPWLEISACRERWIDGLDGEPPLDWVRRQLGLGPDTPIEPYLDRLLVRMWEPGAAEDAANGAVAPSSLEEDCTEFVERYVIGLDDRRGSISVPGTIRRGGYLALALPDADRARESLRSAVSALAPSPVIIQFACRARDETLHGDPDLESALVAHAALDRTTLGTIAPFQLGPSGPHGSCRRIVHSTVLAALGAR